MAEAAENRKDIEEVLALLNDAVNRNDTKETLRLSAQLHELKNPSLTTKLKRKVKGVFDSYGKEPLSDKQPHDDRAWTCELCTTINRPGDANCTSCMQMRGDRYTYEQRQRFDDLKNYTNNGTEEDGGNLNAEWMCKVCDQTNEHYNRVCSTCDEPRKIM